MFLRLFLLFALIPIIEIYLFVVVGGLIGAFWTIAIVLATAAAGAWLARRQGVATLMSIRESMSRGEVPAMALVDGALILVAGVVLLTPGFFTDAIGFLLLVPLVRMRIKRYLFTKFQEWARQGRVTIVRRPPPHDL